MGIAYTSAKILLNAKKDNISFENVLTIGRQSLFLFSSQLLKLEKQYQIDCHREQLKKEPYAETFLKIFLGAKSVTSLDCSDYEQCSILHDMNYPVEKALHEKYDVVIDGGSLEHVFNFPVALANCMNMVKKGGSLFVFSMANNHLGHGFYQLSPELFYRVFQKQYGYAIRTLLLEEHPFPGGELTRNNKLYDVVDPEDVGQRVGLINKNPLLISVHAVRKEITTIFDKYPIQSDYISGYNAIMVNNNHDQKKTILKSVKHLIKALYFNLPLQFQECILDCRNLMIGYMSRRKYSLSNKYFFRRTRI
jgi:SAM-dependent methyltransferase